jgi:hypothetical protein
MDALILIGAICLFLFGIDALLMSGRRQKLRTAETAYRSALVALNTQPGSAALQQSALTLGRQYSDLTRRHKGTTSFVGWENEVRAVTQTAALSTVEDQMKQIESLCNRGVITATEYQERRAKLEDE